jgi:hypothetical protein
MWPLISAAWSVTITDATARLPTRDEIDALIALFRPLDAFSKFVSITNPSSDFYTNCHVTLQVSSQQLCELESASLRTQYHLELQGVLDAMRVDGHTITAAIGHAHMTMLKRWEQLFPLIRFDDSKPGNLNKYVACIVFGTTVIAQLGVCFRRRRPAHTRSLH